CVEQRCVEVAQKIDRFEVFATAEAIGNPLAGGTTIVEIQHRSYGIDTQSVGVIAVEPKQPVADQKAAHLIAAVIENVTAPFAVHALARVGMLVEMGSIEISEAVLVRREV